MRMCDVVENFLSDDSSTNKETNAPDRAGIWCIGLFILCDLSKLRDVSHQLSRRFGRLFSRHTACLIFAYHQAKSKLGAAVGNIAEMGSFPFSGAMQLCDEIASQ